MVYITSWATHRLFFGLISDGTPETNMKYEILVTDVSIAHITSGGGMPTSDCLIIMGWSVVHSYQIHCGVRCDVVMSTFPGSHRH